MPIEYVMQLPPTATPSCAQFGGRYKRSPGSSTSSCSALKRRQHLERRSRIERRVEALRDAPASPAAGLQQEHVVAVDVRADAAAVAGPRNHEIVEPRIGHKAKPLQQCVRVLVVQIDSLHEQCPAPAGAEAAMRSARSVLAPSDQRDRPVLRTPRRDSTSSHALPERTGRFATTAGEAPR